MQPTSLSLSPSSTDPDPVPVLSGSIEPTRLSTAYRVGLVVVALAMLLLPLIYVSIVAATGAAVWWHVTRDTWILSGSGFRWRLLAYAAPALIGGVLLFFMVKPILARPAKRHEPVPIDPENEPDLFAFIHQICRQVRAPVPRRVQVDCQINASASFMPGALGLLRRDLVLTIGLPLAAGLSVRELGGVLAHEFGHFAQGGGMRLTMLVRSVNGWFARVVYERDKWDERLEKWASQSDSRVSIVLALAMGAIWVSRRILTGLMMAGHAISCFMMRQMEYDADSYEVKFAGSEAFARTSARLREMGAAAQVSYSDLGSALTTRALPANLPLFVVDRLGRLPDGLLQQLRALPARKTGVFDTHPSDTDRVRAAESIATTGVLVGGDGAATALFRDFEALGAAATRHHYEHDLGLALEALTLVDTERAVRDSRTREGHYAALWRFFAECRSTTHPLRLPIGELEGLDDARLTAALGEARDTMAVAAPTMAAHYRRAEELEMRCDKAGAAEELLLAGYSFASAADFDLAEATVQCAVSTKAWALDELRTLRQSVDPFDAAAARRLACGALLAAGASRSEEPVALATTFGAVGAAMPLAVELRRLDIPLGLLKGLAAAQPQPNVAARTAALDSRITTCRGRLREALRGVPCPQWLSAAPADVATWCGLSQPAAASSDVIGRIFQLYTDLLGRLAALALEAEDAVPPT